ncbi:MAG: glycosyltransferase family 9 protein [Muribaculaceae bacterium]|nr:glycosyltransferase family 9 protein [Muribaculaceae bacterium]
MPINTIGKKQYRNVLIARFSALGDVAMSIPVVYSLCRCNPSTRFIFITKPIQQPLFINAPDNLIVLGIDLKVKYSGIRGLYRLFCDLRKEYDIDAFADLHGVIRSYVLRALCLINGIKYYSINKGRANKRALTRSRNKVMLPLISSRARYREVFFRFGFPLEERFKSLYVNGKADPTMFADITKPKDKGETWIGIAPFAKHRGKIYPLDSMETVVKQLSQRSNTHIFLFGGGDEERKVLSSWAERHDNVISLADKRYGFPKELALLSHMDTMISMDSANMHLASLVGVRVISVWGATHPYCGFKGFKQNESDIVQLPMACRPCSVFGNKPCARGDYHCMAGIPPQLIITKVQQILDTTQT